MTNRLSIRLVWGIALAVLVAGLAMSIGTVTDIKTTIKKLNIVIKASGDLHAEELRMQKYKSAVKAFKEIDIPRYVNVEAMAKQMFNKSTLDIRKTDLRSIKGWQVKEIEISLKNVRLSAVADFVNQLEASRPPLRLRKSVIRATPSAGTGDVVLKVVSFRQL
ncbi:hypothetical protein H8D64_02475 [PVC group bacterium]|nr:hypothetical protein [PVC group bacterium]